MTHSTSMSNSATLTANGIEVTELPDIEVSASDGVFGAVLSAYRHEGFEPAVPRLFKRYCQHSFP